jgi:hypothetical protein
VEIKTRTNSEEGTFLRVMDGDRLNAIPGIFNYVIKIDADIPGRASSSYYFCFTGSP